MIDPFAITQADLNAANDRRRRAQMGPPLAASDAQLDALADVGEHDLPLAESLWRQANPGPLARLLDAEPED